VFLLFDDSERSEEVCRVARVWTRRRQGVLPAMTFRVCVCACSLSLTKKFRRVITAAAAATGPFSHLYIYIYSLLGITRVVCIYIYTVSPVCVHDVCKSVFTRIILYTWMCLYIYIYVQCDDAVE